MENGFARKNIFGNIEGAISSLDLRTRARKISEYLFHAMVIVYLLYQFLLTIGWNQNYYWLSFFPFLVTWMSYCRYVLFALALAKVLYSWKRGVFTVFLLIISWIVSYVSHSYNNVYDFMAFFLLSDLGDEEQILKTNFAVHLGAIFLFGAAIILDRAKLYWREDVLTLGFSNQNGTAAFILSVLLMIWQLWLKDKKKIWTFALFWPFIFEVVHYQDCITVALLLFLFPVLSAAVDALSRSRHEKKIRMAWIIPWIFMALSVGVMLWLASYEEVPYFTTYPFKTFSERFGDAAKLIKKYGVTWMGVREEWTLGYTTDNLFLNLLLCQGIVGLIIVTVTISWSFIYFYKKKRYDYIAVSLLFMLYSFMEGEAIVMIINYIPMVALARAERKNHIRTGPREKRSLKQNLARNRGRLLLSGMTVLAVLLVCVTARPATEVWPRTPIAQKGMPKTVTAALRSKQKIQQTFVAPKTFRAASFQVFTNGTKPFANLRAVLTDEEGNKVEDVKIRQSVVRDGQVIDILFREKHPEGSYTLTISGSTTRGTLAIWQDDTDPYPDGAVIEADTATENDLMLYLSYSVKNREVGKVWTIAAGCLILIMIWMVPWRKKPDPEFA